MIPKDMRLADLDSKQIPGKSRTYGIVDYDRRQFLNLTVEDTGVSLEYAVGDGNYEPTTPQAVLLYGERFLNRLCDDLGTDPCSVTVNPRYGEVLSKLSGPNQEYLGACWPHYPTPGELGIPSHIGTIKRSELLELERLGRSFDLVSYKTESGQVEKAVFRYFFARQEVHRHLREQQALLHIRQHPNLNKYERAVLDDTGQVVVGYLAKYIPGGFTVYALNRPFKLSWMQQLLQVVDDINLKFGFAHGDIQLGHILIDEPNDRLKLIDLGLARPRTDGRLLIDIHMTVATVYEIITGEKDPFDLGHIWDEVSMIQHLDALPDWTPHAQLQLDHDLAVYRSILQNWATKRIDNIMHLASPWEEEAVPQHPVPNTDRCKRKRSLQSDSNDENSPNAKRVHLDQPEHPTTSLPPTPGTSYLPVTAPSLFPAPLQFLPHPIIKPLLLPDGTRSPTDLLTINDWPDRSEEPVDAHDPIVKWSRPSEAKRPAGVHYLANGQMADERTVSALYITPSPRAVWWDLVGALQGDRQVQGGTTNTAFRVPSLTPSTSATASSVEMAAAAATARADAATEAARAAAKMAVEAAEAATAASRAAKMASECAAAAAAAVDAASAVAERIVRRGGGYYGSRRDASGGYR